MNARVRDISHWNTISNWVAFSKATDMVLIRTGQNDWEDDTFRDKYSNAVAQRMRIGLWHFLQPDKPAIPQAQEFVRILKSLGRTHRVIVWDCEEIDYWTRDVPSVHVQIYPESKEQYTALLMDVLDYTEREMGKVPGIYSRKNFIEQWVLPAGTKFSYAGKEYTAPDWNRYFFWVANYGVISPAVPSHFKTWKFWQDGADLPAGATDVVDRDWFNGDVAALDAFIGGTEVITPVNPDITPIKLSWPCDPVFQMGQRFGDNPSAYKPYGLPGHEGIDFLTIMGSNVYSMADGIVEEVDKTVGPYGIHVAVKHVIGSLVFHSIYAHLQSGLVSVGDEVKAGTRIALSDNTGNSTGPHLHVTVKVDGYTTPGWPEGYIDFAAMLRQSVPPVALTTLRMVLSGVRVRLNPGITGKIIGQVNVDDSIPVVSDAEVYKDGYYWVPCKVWIARGTGATIYGVLK